MKNLKVHFSSASDEWATPKEFFDKYNQKYGPFTLDVCATKENSKCPSFYGLDVGLDGLKADWSVNAIPGPKCWMNPIYSEPEHPCKAKCTKKRCLTRGHCLDVYKPGQIDWITKAYNEAMKGCTVCMLLPARTDTTAFHRFIWDQTTNRPYEWVKAIEFIKGRIKFEGAENSAPFPSMIIIFENPYKR